MFELTTAIILYFYTISAVLGLCMGSFLNCFAHRYAKNESVIKGRSKCALCGHTLSAAELVPVFSWLFLKGKCRYCGAKISPLYVFAELICAAAYTSVFFRFGFSLEALRFLILASLLFAAAFTDIYSGLIPDRLTVIGAACAFLFALFPAEGTVLSSLLRTLLNGLSVSLPLLFFVHIFNRIMKKDTMGGGDIKLMFLIGLYFGWELNILILILACIFGIAFALINKPNGEKHGQPGAFSFAPSLALAAWCAMLWGDAIISWYSGLFMF